MRVSASRSPVLQLLDEALSSERLAAALDLDDPEMAAVVERALGAPVRDTFRQRGKELRARLFALSWELAGGEGHPPTALAYLVEILHAGSLVVDDIEDDSVERRGAPALHRVHGTPVALNAANWLYCWAPALLETLALPAHVELVVQRRVAKTMLRCHYGQSLDLGVPVTEVPQARVMATVRTTTRLKTASLFELAVSLGALTAGADAAIERPLVAFARAFGVFLQMLDDQSGVARRIDKGREDVGKARLTWPWAWLAEDLDATTFERLQAQQREVVAGKRATDDVVRALGSALGDRGRTLASMEIGGAFAALACGMRHTPLLEQLRAEIESVERSFA
jgi:geranylgeranyl pyrophosphate synthase